MSLNAADQTAIATGTILEVGGTPTPAAVSWLRSWFARENTAAAFNPLASTLRLPGSVDLPGNSAHVQQYQTAQQGVQATAHTLTNGNYPTILMAIKSGDPAAMDRQGLLANDFHTWSAGPNAPASAGYKSVYGTAVKDVTGGKSSSSNGLVNTLGETLLSLNPVTAPLAWISGLVGGAGGVVGGITSTAQAATSAVTVLTHAAAWVTNPHNWVRILEIGGGLAAIAMGLHMLAGTSTGPIAEVAAAPGDVVHTAAKTAKTAGETAGAAAVAA